MSVRDSKWVFSLSTALLLVWSGITSGFPLHVDIGSVGQTVKSGWAEFTGNHNSELDPKTEVYDVNGVSVSVSLRTGVLNDSGYRNYGGGELGGDMIYPDNFDGPLDGRVILTLTGLPAGNYVLISYHNDSKDTHAQQDPIDVTVSGSVTASTGDFAVVQTKSMDDNGLGESLVTFTADGNGDVTVTYKPTTDAGVVSKAVLNGLELQLSGARVEFQYEASSGFETVSPAVLTVSLHNPPAANTVEVDYAAAGGTAVVGEDYILSSGTLTFPPPITTQNIEISIINDGEDEEDETIEIALFNPVNATLGIIPQHSYTIVDPRPKVGFTTSASEGMENVSPVHIPVTLSWTFSEPVTVDYNTTGGTATNGDDYSLTQGSLEFGPYETTEYIALNLIEDVLDEDPDETIEITLSDPNNAQLGDKTQHTFTILPPAVQVCPQGDLDGDCDVDFNDVRVFTGQWLAAPGSCSGFDCADIDGVNGVQMQDYAFLAGHWKQEAWPVVINELMASNNSTVEDPCEPGDYPDWIELYNDGPLAVDLGGMHLTDRLSNPTKWQIPPGVTIGPGEYLLFWADGNDQQGPTHTSFKISADGDEDVGLFDTDGATLIDKIEFDRQVSDISYGRYPDAASNLRFFATPTPGWANSGAYIAKVADTKFSHDRGFYDSPFDVSITCETGGADIHYTLDGSEPSEFAQGATYLYTGPFMVNQTTVLRAAAFKPGYLPTNVDTQTYLFLDDVISQPDMDPSVVAAYSNLIEDAFESVPTLSIAMDANDLVNLQAQDSRYPSTGLPKKELPTSVELIYADPNEGEGFQMNCGIEGHSWALDKRSCKLIFKSLFGPTQLRYPFFESAPVNADSAVDEFDRIVLRASKNMEVTYAGDQWTRDSEIAMSDTGAHGTYVHLYLNGTYWGLYNATERPDAWFTSSYFGGEKEDYFATNHGIERGEDHISGDSTRFDTMISMAQAQNLEDPGNYETFKGLCDVTKFADYTILFWFSGFGDNIDNNWYAGMRNVPLIGEVPPEGFMMFMWDAEYVFQNKGGPPGNSVPWVPSYYFSMTGYTIVDVWNALRENTDFMILFGDRIYRHCFNDGALTDGNAQARWDAITADINDAAICELARWPAGGGYSGPATVPPATVDMNGFVDIFMTALDSWGGLYPTIDPPVFNQHGGHVAVGFGLTMTNPNGSGTIYYTLDGSDPRQAVTGNPVGTVYTGPVTLNQSVHVKARVFDNPNWSALAEAVFAAGPVADNLRVTEIMYHPVEANDPNEEFIELKNIGAETINLNLVRFTDGIDFVFPSLSLSPGQYVAAVQDAVAFMSRYPGFSGILAGEYEGRLNNAGERIRTEDAVGTTILGFRYKDGWRSITDGGGYSLTMMNPDSPDANDWSRKDSWRPSAYVGGSPGWDDSGIVPNPGAVVINELMAHSHDSPDWIELYNTTTGDIDIGGWFLSDSDSNIAKYEIAVGTTIPHGDYLVFYEDVNFNDTNDPGCYIPFALSENGEKVCLSGAFDSNGFLTGYREVEDFGASQTNVSMGRYYKASTGNYNFVALDYNTPGAANADPKVGPIVISEIMYHPDWPPSSLYDNEKYEYVELVNISGDDVTLYDYNEHEAWKFTDGIDFTFPSSPTITIPAGGYLLVVKDPEAFTLRYPAVPVWRVLGSYSGHLRNSGEKLETGKPGDTDEFSVLHYIRIDRINYSDGSHPEDCPNDVDLWPTEPDGGGQSLTRTNLTLYGNDPCNWHAASPTPQSTVGILYINEFQADNAGTIYDDHGDYDDWIELCNAGPSEIDLSDMYLTDDLATPTRWQIPVGVTIEPGEYLLFWADGETGEGDLHTKFELSKGGGEDVGLFDTDGTTLIDGVSSFPAMSTDKSYGREPDGVDNWTIFNSPTPGGTN